MKLIKILVILILTQSYLTFCLAEENYYVKQKFDLILEFSNKVGINKELINQVIKDYEVFSIENPDSVYSIISLFNIGQMYEVRLIDNANAKLYFYKTLYKVMNEKGNWIQKDKDIRFKYNEYGGLSASRLVEIYFREGDINNAMKYLEILVKEFPDACWTPTVLNLCARWANTNEDLRQYLPQLVQYMLNNYQGKWGKSILGNSTTIYLLLAEYDVVKVSECESLKNKYFEKYGSEIEEKEKNFINDWFTKLKNKKIDTLIEYKSIDRLPRM